MREVAQWRASLPEMQLIFEGKVSAQELKAGNLNSAVHPLSLTTTGRYRIVHLTANRIYRGPTEKEILLRTGLGTSDCGYPFETGATYLVYANKLPDGTWGTSICHGTQPIEDAGADLRFLSGSAATAEDLMSPREYEKHYFEDILPKQTGSICGLALHPDGTPIKGALVELYELRNDELPARRFADDNTSAENGHFCIKNAEPGRYLLTVNNDDFDHDAREMAYYPGVSDRSKAVPVEIHAGEKLPDAKIRTFRERLYGIRIHVTAVDGTRFSYKNGCGVAIHSPKSDALSYQVSHVLQEDGSYTFGYIPAGPYTVTTYFQPNYEDPERRLFPEASRWKPASREIVVRGDTDVEIQMEPSKN